MVGWISELGNKSFEYDDDDTSGDGFREKSSLFIHDEHLFPFVLGILKSVIKSFEIESGLKIEDVDFDSCNGFFLFRKLDLLKKILE